MSSELEKGIYTLLSTNSPLTSAGTRVYPSLPQGVTFPAIRYTRVSTTRTLALNANVGVTNATVQIDCFAQSYSAAKALADAVRVILHGYTGSLGTLTARLVKLEMETDFVERDGDRETYMIVQRYAFHTDMD